MKGELRPLLLLDVDGVLNPYPECPEGYSEYEFFPDDDEPVRLAQVHGDWLRELDSYFTMVWATGWGADANRLLCPFYGLPELPMIPLPQGKYEPSVKVKRIEDYVGKRATAWVDDVVTEEFRRWVVDRPYPTLLVEVDHEVGLTRDAVDQLIAWAEAIPT